MVVTNFTKNQVSLFLGGSVIPYPTYMMIGSGSGTALATQTEMIYPYDRQAMTQTSLSDRKVKYTSDWTALEMSGLNLTEFSVLGSAVDLTGSIWSRTSFPNVSFNGTQELRIEENWEVY